METTATETTTLRPDDLVGQYTIISGEKNGQPEPEDRIRGTMVRFTATTVTVTDKEKKETYVASYELDPSQDPCRITMTSTRSPHQGAVAQGLIEHQGDAIRLIYALPGGPPPTGFRTGPNQLSFVMKPLKK